MARSSDGDEDEELVRWQKLVELGPDRGLRESGLSQASIDKVLSFVNRSEQRLDWEAARKALSDIEDGMAMLLAFYGRGSERQHFLEISDQGSEHMKSNEATALCVNMACNTSITSLHMWGPKVFGIDQKIMTLFANALRTNSTLTDLELMYVGMGSEAVRILLDGLRANKNLLRLSLDRNPLLDEGVKFVGEFLCSNTSLVSLSLTKTGCGFEGAQLLFDALDHNTTLEQLIVGRDDFGRDGMKKLLEPFTRDTTISSDGPQNTTLKSLHLYSMSREGLCVDSVARMIKVNKTFTCLCIDWDESYEEDWTGKIFPALQENKTLKRLYITRCTGLDSEEVRSSFISLIKEGKIGLEEIEFLGVVTSWDAQVSEELRINKAYRDRLRDQPMVAPTSRRIILCGREFAGKTTIRNTMERTVQGTPWYHTFHMAYKGVMRTFPHLRQAFFGTDAPKELAERTRGFDILVLKEKPRTSMWDFAGQKEYYALHDYMFPNAENSYFLYVCSCRCPPTKFNLYGEFMTREKMKDDCSYWLRFIASNSKPKQVKDSEAIELPHKLPHVQFVLTNIDTLPRNQQVHSKQWARKAVDELREQFKKVIELSENVETVNAHNDADVKHLILELACPVLEKIVERQRVYKICEEVQSALDTWSKTAFAKPIVSLAEFRKICQELKELTLAKEEEASVLGYLNDMGDVIYPAGLDFIVVKPRWFGRSILGYLVDAFGGQRSCSISDCITGHSTEPPRPPDNGFLDREHIESLLSCSLETMNETQTSGISVERLVQLMILLEMCFEEEDPRIKNSPPLLQALPRKKNSRLFLPVLFDNKEDTASRGERKLTWSTRGEKVVYLGRRLQCEDESTTILPPGFFPRLQVHLLQYLREKKWTNKDGFEFGRNLIRFTEKGHDICIEYSGNVGYFIDIMVRSSEPFAKALQFIGEHVIKIIHQFCAKVCKGVELVEAVVRPTCVQRLMKCAERKAHSVLVSNLKHAEKEDPGCRYTWDQSIPSLLIREDRALHLLEGEPSPESSSSAKSASSAQKLPDFYIRADPGFWTNLKKRASVAGVKPFKLHLYCNYEDGSENRHEVEGQSGRTISLAWDSSHVFSTVAPVIKSLWNKFGTGFKIDTVIDAVFEGGDIHDVDIKMLRDLQIASETPMETLEKYIHFTGKLEEILKDLKDKTFWEDFRLWKADCPSGKIGWYCKKHFDIAFRQKALRI